MKRIQTRKEEVGWRVRWQSLEGDSYWDATLCEGWERRTYTSKLWSEDDDDDDGDDDNDDDDYGNDDDNDDPAVVCNPKASSYLVVLPMNMLKGQTTSYISSQTHTYRQQTFLFLFVYSHKCLILFFSGAFFSPLHQASSHPINQRHLSHSCSISLVVCLPCVHKCHV